MAGKKNKKNKGGKPKNQVSMSNARTVQPTQNSAPLSDATNTNAELSHATVDALITNPDSKAADHNSMDIPLSNHDELSSSSIPTDVPDSSSKIETINGVSEDQPLSLDATCESSDNLINNDTSLDTNCDDTSNTTEEIDGEGKVGNNQLQTIKPQIIEPPNEGGSIAKTCDHVETTLDVKAPRADEVKIEGSYTIIPNLKSTSDNNMIQDDFPLENSESSSTSPEAHGVSTQNESLSSKISSPKSQTSLDGVTNVKDSLVNVTNEFIKKMKITVDAIHSMEDNYDDSPDESHSAVDSAMSSVVEHFGPTLATDAQVLHHEDRPIASTARAAVDRSNAPRNLSTGKDLQQKNEVPLIFSFSRVLKRFLKVFILTYGFRSALSIIGSFFQVLRKLIFSKSIRKEAISIDIIKGILVHNSRAPYEVAMRIGLLCGGMCSIFEGSEMLIRWLWYKILQMNRSEVRKQKVTFLIQKLKSQHLEEERIRKRTKTKSANQEIPSNSNADNSTTESLEEPLSITFHPQSVQFSSNDVPPEESNRQELAIPTTVNGEEVILIPKHKIIEYAPRLPWQTAIAGFISGLALYAVKDPESKRTMSLYFFARFLQCVYNSLKRRGHLNMIFPAFKHYDSLLFMVSTAQIMYAWVTRRFALPPSYARFITKTGPIDQPVLDLVEAVHTPAKSVDATLPNLLTYLSKFYNAEKAERIVANVQKTHFVPCSVLHPRQPSCTLNFGRVFKDVTRKIFPLYGVLTLVSVLLLKRKSIFMSPGRTIFQGLFNVCRSTAFLATFVAGYQYFICGQRALHSTVEHRFIYWVAGFVASAAIFIEQKPRRSELALYVLPRGLDALYLILQKRRWLSTVPFGELLLFCLSLSGIMVAHFHDRESLGSLPNFILKTFFSNQIVKWIE